MVFLSFDDEVDCEDVAGLEELVGFDDEGFEVLVVLEAELDGCDVLDIVELVLVELGLEELETVAELLFSDDAEAVLDCTVVSLDMVVSISDDCSVSVLSFFPQAESESKSTIIVMIAINLRIRSSP